MSQKTWPGVDESRPRRICRDTTFHPNVLFRIEILSVNTRSNDEEVLEDSRRVSLFCSGNLYTSDTRYSVQHWGLRTKVVHKYRYHQNVLSRLCRSSHHLKATNVRERMRQIGLFWSFPGKRPVCLTPKFTFACFISRRVYQMRYGSQQGGSPRTWQYDLHLSRQDMKR